MAPGPKIPRAWQRMLSGRRLDLLDPSPLDVEISDIAHGLARVARWNGQTRGDHAFSVAQHSLIVETIVGRLTAASPDTLQLALLHDAPEYVIGDMISPFKAVVGGGYKSVEGRLEAAIHLRFGLPPVMPAPLKALIKRADRIAAYFEATELAGFSDAEARACFGPPRGIGREMIDVAPRSAAEVQTLFLARFEAIEALRRPERG
ncbi:hydrolase [Hoeflea sp. BAL378]|uniref:YfbR-like 5'-deoxynucleotidase n=1 Tax=Hoeflea sp. BAL378 TaxID=1547437 RepID=UPI000512E984|nr:HD family hydrolase [Hoeflea sp. BAL378]KGF66735.1 hydrolase [Hoeflea sp. BAL378]